MAPVRADAPWQSVAFKPAPIPGMLSGEEKRYLYWLTAHAWRDRGHVVELGPWLGGSTSCLAAGMAARPAPPRHRLHTFDTFVWRAVMDGRVPDPPGDGESFLPLFQGNVAAYGDLVVPHAMALPDNHAPEDAEGKRWLGGEGGTEGLPLLRWAGGPVEVLFVDGAKTWDALRHLLLEFRGSLAEGALLVLQDYKHWAHYWVPAQAELLGGRLELLHVLPRNTVTFRLRSPLAEADLARIPPFASLDAGAALAALEGAARRLEGHGDREGAWVVRLGAVRCLAHAGRWDEAVARFGRLEAGWPFGADDAQLEALRSWLQGERSVRLRPAARTRLRRLLRPAKAR